VLRGRTSPVRIFSVLGGPLPCELVIFYDPPVIERDFQSPPPRELEWAYGWFNHGPAITEIDALTFEVDVV